MRNALKWYFWLETGMAVATAILFAITLVWRSWIEIVFNIDPDNRSGTLEWLIVGTLLMMTLVLFTMAGYEWRRARAAIS